MEHIWPSLTEIERQKCVIYDQVVLHIFPTRGHAGGGKTHAHNCTDGWILEKCGDENNTNRLFGDSGTEQKCVCEHVCACVCGKIYKETTDRTRRTV